MDWERFVLACPEIAELAEQRFRKDEVVLVGTLRKDGSPRISPNEVDFAEGRLLVSMMWRSKKALDLLRDPRCIVHSAPSGRTNPGGDVKLHGRVVDERDPGVRKAFRDTMHARIGWAPDEPEYHLFSLDVREAAYVVFRPETWETWRWDPEHGLRKETRPND